MSEFVASVLVVDDEANVRKLLGGVLEDEGYAVAAVESAEEALPLIEGGGIDLLLLDVQLPGMDGLALLERVRAMAPALPVLMMSGHASIRTAVKATRLGAQDFIEKPVRGERLLLSIENCLHLRRLQAENEGLREALGPAAEMIGEGPAMARLRDEIARVGPTEARVLITGENGTGKELVARALFTASPRRERPFVKVNCAAIPSELLESELFGHERGAFTGAVGARRGKFELAQGGTILLDEIGDMNPTTQAKLLRVLEENEMERLGGERSIALDLRVLASTNQDLEARLADGFFRRDLYHRLKVVPIHVPPLRERAEDIPLLAEHFLARYASENGRQELALDADARARLAAHAWPGNVRELRNLMERMVIMSSGELVTARDLAPLLAGGEARPEAEAAGGLAERLEAHERRLVREALDAAGGNVAEAARSLRLDRANLHRKLKRLGLKD